MERSPIMRRPTIQFGNYHFERDGTPAPIEWSILDERETPSGKQKLLWSKYILEIMPFDSLDLTWAEEEKYTEEVLSCASACWGRCSLREWLNCNFFNIAFTKEEQKQILPVDTLSKKDLSMVRVPDHIFLLSVEEFRSYFPKYECRPRPKLTPYSYKVKYPVTSICLGGPEHHISEEKLCHGNTSCWLRSETGRGGVVCDEDDYLTLTILFNPKIPIRELIAWEPYYSLGVRPAIWVQFDNETENEKGEK